MKMKVIAFRAEDELLDLLDRYAIKHRITRSEAIRKAIEIMVRQ